MRVRIVKQGKYPGSYECMYEDRVIYLKASSKLTTPLIVGADYEIVTFKPEGMKTTYITEATSLSNFSKDVKSSDTPKKVEKETERVLEKVVKEDDKMSKKDWEEKDRGIKWQTCFKSVCVFHAHRPDSTITDVIRDAKQLYCASSIIGTPIVEVVKQEDLTDVFDENAL